MKYVLGIDIGGTNLRLGTVARTGKVSNFEKKSSTFLSKTGSWKFLTNEINLYINKYDIRSDIAGISIGVPSIVSKDKSFIYSSPNLQGLQNIDLGNLLQKELGIPVFVDRDVNYILINDIENKNLDPAKDKTILGFYLGTGLGNAVYINGRLHTGKNGVSGELGHVPMYRLHETCPCGNIGCAELRCSGKYLTQIQSEHFKDTEIPKIFARHRDDPIIKEYIDTLAIPMATEINILDPDYIILSGGVMKMQDFPIKSLTDAIRKRTRKPVPEENLEFIYPNHSHSDGVVGGAYYVFDKLGLE